MYAIRSYYGRRSNCRCAGCRRARWSRIWSTIRSRPRCWPPPSLRLTIDREALAHNWRALDRLSGRASAGAAVVITSYSIHYTKLYEATVFIKDGKVVEKKNGFKAGKDDAVVEDLMKKISG